MSARQPTAPERAEERAFILTSVADTAITIAILVVAFASGSLTMLSEMLRGILLLTVQLYTLWLLIAAHRGRFVRFEYGIGKLERLVFVVVGIGLVVGAYWVLQNILAAFAGNGPPASPLGLAFAAIINAVNLGINFIGWHSMRAATRGRDPGLLGAELSARFGALVGSAILQITLTAGALAKDPVVVLSLDAFGAGLVALLMTKRGLKMVIAGVSSLLDRPPDVALADEIRASVHSAIPMGHINAMRMRKGGQVVFVDVAVDPSAFGAVQQLAAQTDAAREALRGLATPVDLTVAVGTAHGAG